MYSIALPDLDDDEMFARCIEYRRELEVKDVLDRLAPSVRNAYHCYTTYRGDPMNLSPRSWEREDRKALQSNYSLAPGSPFARYRRDLIARFIEKRCPMCGRGDVGTIDHYLPRSKFPEYSVLSANLIPVCGQCNLLKSSHFSTEAGRRFVHAYYDILPSHPVLIAHVRLNERLDLSFAIVEPPGLPADLLRVLQFHFNQLDLAVLFEKEGIRELTERYGEIEEAFERGPRDLAEYLGAAARSARKKCGVHSWKTAMFAALEHHEAFCAGGFELLLKGEDRQDS